jgi:hypothetical protein
MTLRRLRFWESDSKNFGVSFEVGGYFVGKSEFVFDGTKYLSLIRNGTVMRSGYVNQFTVMPSFMLHLNYKLY